MECQKDLRDTKANLDRTNSTKAFTTSPNKFLNTMFDWASTNMAMEMQRRSLTLRSEFLNSQR